MDGTTVIERDTEGRLRGRPGGRSEVPGVGNMVVFTKFPVVSETGSMWGADKGGFRQDFFVHGPHDEYTRVCATGECLGV